MTASRATIVAGLALSAGFAAFFYLLPRNPSFGMFLGNDDVDVVRLVISFAATIAGVVLGSFYRNLRALQSTGATKVENPREFLGEMLLSIDLWLGIAGAPIVYALLLQSTASMTLPGIIVMALENGFCCLVIVNGFVAHQDSGSASRRGGSRQSAQRKLGSPR